MINIKKTSKIVLWVASLFLVYLIYNSISAPIFFKEIKKERYTYVIDKLKDIKMSQEAHRSVNGIFASNFEQLKTFVDTANFIITQQRDTSWIEYDPAYNIDVPKEGVVIDTLGYVSVKDSLFGDSDNYKNMDVISIEGNEEQHITMKSKSLQQGGYAISVFEAKLPKDAVLFDQPKNLVTIEKEVISVDEIDGMYIKVGSLEKVSTSGNWPATYDKRRE